MIRVYEYGCLPPTENRELVLDQMRLARRYQNALVEIERRRRDAVRACEVEDARVGRITCVLAYLERRLTRLRGRVKERSTADRRKSDRKTATAWTLARLKAMRALHRVACRAARDASKTRLDEIHAAATVERKKARASCGVYWGTYLLVEQAMDAAAKAALKETTSAETVYPHFRRWDGEGRIGVSRSGHEMSAMLAGTDLLARIDPVPAAAWDKRTPRGQRARLARTLLRIRVQSDEHHEPVWAVLPMIMHRPLPEGGEAQVVVVSRRMVADHERWTCQITVRDLAARQLRALPSGDVAVDLGWRGRTSGRRVGYWMGSDGAEGEILAEPEVAAGLRKADELESIRDLMLDRAKVLLASWLREHPVPEWMATLRVSHLAQWRSQGRMARLAMLWARQPDREEPIARWLEAWYREDRHVWQWAAHQRRKALLRRREGYRRMAAMLAERYGTLVLERLDLRPLARRAPAEQQEALPGPARRGRQDAAPSEARMALRSAFSGRGGEVREQEAAWTTRDCALCGHRNEWPDQEPLHLVCAGCGAMWDQDWNAALNLLRAAMCGGGSGAPLAARKPGRTARLREAVRAKRDSADSPAEVARDMVCKDPE